MSALVDSFHANDWEPVIVFHVACNRAECENTVPSLYDEPEESCPACAAEEAYYAALFARQTPTFGCPTCGGQRVDEQLLCHDCLVGVA